MSGIRESIYSNLLFEDRWMMMAEGLVNTLKVSLWSILLATLMGGILCAVRMNSRNWSRTAVKWYVELMRAIPLLVLLLLLFYVVLADVSLSSLWVSIICFTLYFSAYFCEIFRSGIEGVNRGQWEAGFALGLTPWRTFMKVILPQALKKIIPVYKGQMITLVKSTSIIGYVAVVDLTKAGDIIRSRTFDAFFPLLLVAAVYLLLTLILGALLDLFEKRVTPKSRNIKGLFVLVAAIQLLSSCTGKTQDLSGVNSIEDFKGHSVAVAMGSSYDLMLSEIEGVDIIRLGVGELLVAVEKGRADFCIIDQYQARMLDMESRGLEIKFDNILKGNAAAGFRKEDSLLCSRFNGYLSGIRASGEYDRWLDEWKSASDSMADASFLVPKIESKPGGRALHVGITITYPYLFLKENSLTGIEVDMFNRFCERAGYQVDYEIYDFSALIPALNSGKIDVILSHMRKTEERARQVLFSDAYIEGGGAAVCRNANGRISGERAGILSRIKDSFNNNLVVEQRWKLMADGLWVTIQISVLSIVAAVIAGILMCRLRMSRRRTVSSPTGFVIDLLRGIPLLVILMLMFYVIFASSRITGTWVTVMSFGLYYGAYFSEVFRTGMESVERGQWEAGFALGLGKFQTFRKIALPQALSRIIPVLKGEVIALIKMTSVVGYVAVVDLTKASDIIRARTLDAFFPLILVSVVYIILAWLTGWGLKTLESQLTPKSRES